MNINIDRKINAWGGEEIEIEMNLSLLFICPPESTQTESAI